MSDVKIYTKVGCPYCAAAKEDFRKRGVAYREVDVHSVPGAAEEAKKYAGGSQRVPVIVEDGKVTVGFGGS
jgi:glutaredoxin 3